MLHVSVRNPSQDWEELLYHSGKAGRGHPGDAGGPGSRARVALEGKRRVGGSGQG